MVFFDCLDSVASMDSVAAIVAIVSVVAIVAKEAIGTIATIADIFHLLMNAIGYFSFSVVFLTIIKSTFLLLHSFLLILPIEKITLKNIKACLKKKFTPKEEIICATK